VMKVSKLAVFHSAGQSLTIESTAVPALQDGEILVRNEYTTLCRSDLNTFSGKRIETTPTILGHEIVGRIAELTPGAPAWDCRGTALRVGDRVTWAIYASDPATPLARLGLPQKAAGRFKYGHEPILPDSTLHGGLAEYCILRRHTPVIRIDAPIPLPLLALINCSVATVAGSLRLAGPLRGRTVVIAGAGMLGLVACAMCESGGAKIIIALDIADERLATAAKFGANFTVNLRSSLPGLRAHLAPLISDEPITVAFDFSGVPETMETLISLLGIGGTAVFVGATFPQRALQINAEQLIRNIHTIKGLHNYNEADFLAAVEFMEQNFARFPFTSLVYEQFDLDSVNIAFSHALKSNAYRVGICIG